MWHQAVHMLVVTVLMLTAPSGPDVDASTMRTRPSPLDLFQPDTPENREARKIERDRCLTAGGAGIAGALLGAAVLGAPAYIVGVLQNKGPDGELVGEPSFAYKRYFVPGFTIGGAFIGGALALVGTYSVFEPDAERPSSVMR